MNKVTLQMTAAGLLSVKNMETLLYIIFGVVLMVAARLIPKLRKMGT